jgi:hypothetical protein
MTGARTGSLGNVAGIGWASSRAKLYVAETRTAGQSNPLYYIINFSRRMTRLAAVFTIGIRGATPPPAD